MNKEAFTLAEVLITLGIIGIVAAMTLPALTAKYQEKVLLTQVKKSYSTILNALSAYKAKNEVSDVSSLFDTSNNHNQTLEKFAKYFKTSEVCRGSQKGCGGYWEIKPTKRRADGQGKVATTSGYWENMPRMTLTDGTLITVQQYSNCYQEYESGSNVSMDENGFATDEGSGWVRNYCAMLCFDANGSKKPNQAGRDYFCFGVRENGTVYDPKTSNTGSITSVLAEDKLNDTESFSLGTFNPNN